MATFPGQGTVLFGDKTGLTSPSAFDRINVRRLFITLEKAISTLNFNCLSLMMSLLEQTLETSLAHS